MEDAGMTDLESKVLERVVSVGTVSGRELSNVEKELLKTQIGLLRVKARDFTGYGFYTKFECKQPEELSRLPNELKPYPIVVTATHPDVDGYIDFLIWTKDGLIDCLEAASTSSWPKSVQGVQFDSRSTP